MNKLGEYEALYAGVLPWYASLYDPESGGFYAAASGKADPALHAGLEMTGSVLTALNHHGGDLWASLPEVLRERFVRFFDERFCPDTGYFEEPEMVPCEKDTADRYRARIQSFSKRALGLLGAPFVMPTAEDGTAMVPVLPEQFASPEAYAAWMRGLTWTTQAWSAGDRLQASQNYLLMMPEAERAPYIDAMFDFLTALQDPSTGYFGVGTSYCTLSGTFKVDLIYQTHHRTLPMGEQVLASVFHTIDTEKAICPCYVRNALDLLHTLAKQGFADEVRAGLSARLDGIIEAERSFLAPDGGFSSALGKSMGVYGGVRVGHSLFEGDIDGTSMMLIARKIVYSLYDLPIPPLSDGMPDFWERLK